jgi:hypothetical protein
MTASLKTLAVAGLASLTLATGLLASPTSAEARPSRGAAVTAGVIGGLAVGSFIAATQPRHVVVVEKRRVRAARPCGCRH